MERANGEEKSVASCRSKWLKTKEGVDNAEVGEVNVHTYGPPELDGVPEGDEGMEDVPKKEDGSEYKSLTGASDSKTNADDDKTTGRTLPQLRPKRGLSRGGAKDGATDGAADAEGGRGTRCGNSLIGSGSGPTARSSPATINYFDVLAPPEEDPDEGPALPAAAARIAPLEPVASANQAPARLTFEELDSPAAPSPTEEVRMAARLVRELILERRVTEQAAAYPWKRYPEESRRSKG